jgi:hypothetical protein
VLIVLIIAFQARAVSAETVPGAATTHLLPTSRAGVHRARVVELVKTGPDGPGS